MQLAKEYEDEAAQAEAKRAAPLEELKARAREMVEELKKEDPSTPQSLEKDLLLVELLRWFKKDFFSWFDRPECDRCGVKADPKGDIEPTKEEENDGARNVEE